MEGGSYVAVLEESSTWIDGPAGCNSEAARRAVCHKTSESVGLSLQPLVFNFNYMSHLRYQLQLSYVIGEL